MSKPFTARFHPGPAIAVVLTTALCLAGCGSSGKKAGSTAEAPLPRSPSSLALSAAKKLGISAKTQGAAARVGVITLSACLREHRIKVPPQSLSSPQPSFNMKGLDRKNRRVAAAMQTCLPKAEAAYKARLYQGRGGAAAESHASPSARGAAARVGIIALSKCLEEHGVKVPPQPLSSPHPLFNFKGIDTKSAKFQSANRVCLPPAIAAAEARLRKG